MIEIVLDGPPMGKQRVRAVKATGRLYTPERTVNFEGRLALQAQTVMAGRPLLDGPLDVEVLAFMQIAGSKAKKWTADALAGRIRPTKKPDGDNILKIATDALNMVVWIDDAQIVDGRVRKFYSNAPRTVIRIRPADMGIFA